MAITSPLSPRSLRAPSPSSCTRTGSPTPSARVRASASPPLHVSPRAARRSLDGSATKENINVFGMASEVRSKSGAENGHASPVFESDYSSPSSPVPATNGRALYPSSEDDVEAALRRRARRAGSSSSSATRSPPPGVATLPTIRAHAELSDVDLHPSSDTFPPPAPSAGMATQPPFPRRRRRSSVKAKPPPGVTPTKVVDWEIPRKAFHSSIGFITLILWWYDPPTTRPLVKYLCIAVTFITLIDLIRLRSPAFAELWEVFCGFLMRDEERGKINGVVWYIVGVIFVLSLYPRDVAVVSILTLSWSDTTASTIGRLWGRHTPPLPPHFPGVKYLPFAPRKSLAGFLAATVTGVAISLGFWHSATNDWAILGSWLGRLATAFVVGVGGAVVEALDLGVDDNLTLPILTGAIVWTWFAATNLVLGH